MFENLYHHWDKIFKFLLYRLFFVFVYHIPYTTASICVILCGIYGGTGTIMQGCPIRQYDAVTDAVFMDTFIYSDSQQILDNAHLWFKLHSSY